MWNALTQEQAISHPAYGIGGAASILRATSVALPLVGFLQGIGGLADIISKRGALFTVDYLLLLPSVIFVIWSGYNAILLGGKNPSFIRSFLGFLAVGPLISISAFLIWSINTVAARDAESVSVALLSIVAAWAIWGAIWVPYVLFSKRINVTLLRRVRDGDPILLIDQQTDRRMGR